MTLGYLRFPRDLFGIFMVPQGSLKGPLGPIRCSLGVLEVLPSFRGPLGPFRDPLGILEVLPLLL